MSFFRNGQMSPFFKEGLGTVSRNNKSNLLFLIVKPIDICVRVVGMVSLGIFKILTFVLLSDTFAVVAVLVAILCLGEEVAVGTSLDVELQSKFYLFSAMMLFGFKKQIWRQIMVPSNKF